MESAIVRHGGQDSILPPMHEISVYFADGRVVAMRPTTCATVQAIAERAGEVLQHPARRIAIVSKGGTDPLAHEIRLRDIVPSPSVFFALPELLAQWTDSGTHIDLSEGGRVATCSELTHTQPLDAATGGVAACAGELWSGQHQWQVRPLLVGTSSAMIGGRPVGQAPDDFETLPVLATNGAHGKGHFVAVTRGGKYQPVCVDGVAAPDNFCLTFVAKLDDAPELLVYMTWDNSGSYCGGARHELLHRWHVQTPMVRTAGLLVHGHGSCSLAIEDAHRLPQRFTTLRWHCGTPGCGGRMKAERTHCRVCTEPFMKPKPG